MIFSSCINSRRANEIELKELSSYINSFYSFLFDSLEPKHVKKYFLNERIQFYIQNNSDFKHEGFRIVKEDSEIQFVEIINEFYKKSKAIKNIELKKAEFVKQVYDVPINDLFVLDYNVIYENLETTETFFIKKVDTAYKIYRFFINYNKNWDLDL
jgi:hypothetical protein